MVSSKRDSTLALGSYAERKRVKYDDESVMVEFNAERDKESTINDTSPGANAENVDPNTSAVAPQLNELHVIGEKELRRERGEMLVKLFREFPSLADSASARRADKNMERAMMWDQIATKVNDAFGSRLEILSVDKVKKLLSYYKKKEDGNFDCLKIPIAADEVPTKTDPDCCSSPSRCESVMTEHGGLETGSYATVDVTSSLESDQKLQRFIASICSSPVDLSSVSREAPKVPVSPVFPDTVHQLKKERHNFVITLAEHYMERMCFDSSSRSAQVNTERHNMWVKIAHLTNEKFLGLLNPLGVEQTKKLFSNCKRRRRLREERNGDSCSFADSVSVSPDLTCLNASSSTDPLQSLDVYITSNGMSPAENLQMLARDLDLTVQIKDLRRQLAERDAEVARLQRTIVEQANEYKFRLNSIMDILKTATEKKVSEDIRLYLNVV